ncbi:cytochrome c1 [Luteimonas sp. MJ250]|uniref:cytochrome c1 n=1 Tax=Luteimonas sp. MJ250 TaxID=3129236 RepID=UPI0031BB9BEE
MTKPMTLISRVAVFAASMLLSFSALAAAGGPVQHAGTDLSDKASLQRGAQLFMNYCSSCHSLKYLRYSRMAEDLGLTEEEVMANLNFTGAAFGEQILTAMPAEHAGDWFGTVPPDLSLTSRVRGGDWIFSYLKAFYIDEERPLGWNNTVFPNASMPNVLWEMQGIQRPIYGGKDEATGDPLIDRLEVASPGTMDPLQFDQAARDITAFLEYAGEPVAVKREAIGVWVLLFLAFFTFLAWLLKKEYWKDVH